MTRDSSGDIAAAVLALLQALERMGDAIDVALREGRTADARRSIAELRREVAQLRGATDPVSACSRPERARTTPATSDVIGGKELCRLLNISRTTLWRMRVSRTLPIPELVGLSSPKFPKFRRSDVQRYLEARRSLSSRGK